MEEIKETALYWLNSGIATCPLYYRSKIPHSQALIRSGFVSNGKATWQLLKTKLPSEKQIDLWFEGNQPANLAIICGWQNLVILDFDSPENYAAWFLWLSEHNPKILNTYKVQSSRGIHVYFFLTEAVRIKSIQGAPFEVKCAGKLCTIPPSVHESGRKYTGLDDPTRIRIVRPEEILNYFPIELMPPPIVFPLAQRSKFAPVDTNLSTIEQIKKQVSILKFIPDAKPVDSTQHYWRGNCPLHGKHGNFWVDKQLNIGGCWAGCGNFDVISLWARLNNISTKEAIFDLAQKI